MKYNFLYKEIYLKVSITSSTLTSKIIRNILKSTDILNKTINEISYISH